MLIIMMVQKKGNYDAKINTNNFRDKSLRKLRDMGTSSLNQALPWRYEVCPGTATLRVHR